MVISVQLDVQLLREARLLFTSTRGSPVQLRTYAGAISGQRPAPTEFRWIEVLLQGHHVLISLLMWQWRMRLRACEKALLSVTRIRPKSLGFTITAVAQPLHNF